MTSPFGLMPIFMGLANAPFFEPVIPPIIGDLGVDNDVGETGSLVEVPLPPPRPPELGGRLVAGATDIYDFQNGFYGRRTGTPTATTTWRAKDTFTSGPAPWALTSNQTTRLRAIAAQLSGCYGIDLRHAFTCMNIESKFAHDTMLGGSDPLVGYKGPFQYGQIAYRDAFKKPKTHVFTLAELRSIDKQCRAFAIDTIRFTEMLKRKGITPEPWMLYMMHQQGWPTAPRIIKKAIEAPNTNLRNYANRIGRKVWTNILNQASFGTPISNSTTVGGYCNLFKGHYLSNRDGTGGYQPVTDYIEQVNLTVPVGPASGQIALADIVSNVSNNNINGVPKSALDWVVPGVGMDLTFNVDNLQPTTATFIGRLAHLMVDPNRIVMMDVWWGPEVRSGVSILSHFFVSFATLRRFHISQARSYFFIEGDDVEQVGPPIEKIAIWDVDADNEVSRAIGYDYLNNHFLSDAVDIPYGEARIAWRLTATSLSIAVNGNTPVVLESPQIFGAEEPEPIVQSAGYMKIRRIIGFPDNPDPDVLKYVSNPAFKAGTEPGLEPNLPTT